jgi:HK97 family phage prohead protease
MEEKTFAFEVKELEEDGTFEGYAAIFDIVDFGNDLIKKGAFKKTLRENKDLPLLWYHDPRQPIGKIVEAEEDGKGLRIKAKLNLDVQQAKEVYSNMKQKIVRGLSIGYDSIKWAWDEMTRILQEVKLWEISPVTFPMAIDALVTGVKMEGKPYPNEHSARIKNPDQFDPKSFRRKADGTIYGKIKVPGTAAVIWGKLKEHNDPGDNPIPQAIRFPTKDWTVSEAKKWLSDNNVKYEKFEPAAKSLEGILDELLELKSGRVISAANMKLVTAAVRALQALLEAAEPQKSTPDKEKSLFSPVFEALEKPLNTDKPQEHLLGPVFEALENPTKE